MAYALERDVGPHGRGVVPCRQADRSDAKRARSIPSCSSRSTTTTTSSRPRPFSRALRSSTRRRPSAAPDFRMELPIGTSLEASLNTVRARRRIPRSLFSTREYDAFGSLSLRQPLLGGFHVSARKELVRAEQEMDAAKARYDQEVLAVSVRVEQSYWDLYAAERDYAVQNAHTRPRGSVSQGDRASSEDGAHRPESGGEREDLSRGAGDPLPRPRRADGPLVGRACFLDRHETRAKGTGGSSPSTDPPDRVSRGRRRRTGAGSPSRRASTSERPRRRSRRDARLSSAAFWEALPSVDLVGSLGGNGLAGTAQDVVFGSDTLRTTVGGGFGDAASQAIEERVPVVERRCAR